MLYAVIKHVHIHDSPSKSFNAKVSFQDKSLNLPIGGGPLTSTIGDFSVVLQPQNFDQRAWPVAGPNSGAVRARSFQNRETWARTGAAGDVWDWTLSNSAKDQTVSHTRNHLLYLAKGFECCPLFLPGVL